MEFLLLIADRAGEPPRTEVGVEEMGKFARELAERGVLRGATGPLRPADEGVRICAVSGAPVLTDGPFAEAKEVVAGYFVVDAPDRAAALDLAKRCPYVRAGLVELRAAQYWRRREPTAGAQFLLLYLRPVLPGPDEPRLAEMIAYSDELRRRGVHLEGARLPPEEPVVQVEERGGRLIVHDGPFAESKEVVGGYALIQAPDRAAAIEIASHVPHIRWGTLELREVARRAP